MKREENRRNGPFAGIFAGGGKRGFHLAVVAADGTVTDLVRLADPNDILRYVLEISPISVAISGASDSGRMACHALREAFAAGAPEIPLFETSLAMLQDRLQTEDVILPLARLQGRTLRSHHTGLLDAVLCATAARRHHLSGTRSLGHAPDSRSRSGTGQMLLPDDPFRDYTLCIVLERHRILLGMKKRGLGTGYWNGFGGKIEAGETCFEAAARELHEEAGLSKPELAPAGLLQFTFADGTQSIRGYVFRVHKYSGSPTESSEMRPEWFAIERIPYEKMWRDDIFWLPLLLAGKPFAASFHVTVDHRISSRCLLQAPEVVRLFGGKRQRPR